MDFQKFYMGEIYDAYRYLGAHVEQDGVVFRTFAPQAERVTIIGEFNGWQEEEMTQAERAQFFEIRVKGGRQGRADVQICHLRQKRQGGTLRPLWIRYGTEAELRLDRKRSR